MAKDVEKWTIWSQHKANKCTQCSVREKMSVEWTKLFLLYLLIDWEGGAISDWHKYLKKPITKRRNRKHSSCNIRWPGTFIWDWCMLLLAAFISNYETHLHSVFSYQDCRAGLNFCDEHEAAEFRAAIKERITEFKRKRQGMSGLK